jgi:hypothetical protein
MKQTSAVECSKWFNEKGYRQVQYRTYLYIMIRNLEAFRELRMASRLLGSRSRSRSRSLSHTKRYLSSETEPVRL